MIVAQRFTGVVAVMGTGYIVLLLVSVLQGLLLLVAYITGGSFPRPLSEEEEAEYLERMAAGDTEARNALIEHNLRLVAHIVKKYEGSGVENDDLISIGTIGLIKAINTYDRSKGIRLATYAARCIENEILMCMRSLKKRRGEVSLSDPIGFDKEGNEITLSDVLGTDPDEVIDRVESNIERKRLYERLKFLGRRERKVLEMRFGLLSGIRFTQREVAKQLGISRSYVSRIEKKAITKLLSGLAEITGSGSQEKKVR
ncbi:MAG: polymerase sporulation-specific sigma factor [Eubacteriales bacterium]|nr:polymerase sporulation-specific sigma factor [Eubacteriales bacterium]MDN5363133.1 polymerase sporulation-specific sigma factor [Eubacteriales bacterium]